MKKLSLKKTTLSRLNNNALNNVKGGQIVLLPETQGGPCGTDGTNCMQTYVECETKNNCGYLTDGCIETDICSRLCGNITGL